MSISRGNQVIILRKSRSFHQQDSGSGLGQNSRDITDNLMKYIFIILSLFFCTGAVGQDRFISSVQKKQYKWVEKNLIPLLDNDSSSITLPYAASLYFMDIENPQYSVSEAYKFLQRAEKRFQQCTDKKILQHCAALSINNLQFNLLHDSICLVAFTEAMKSQNIQQMEFYLSYFNTAPFEFRQKTQENLHLISFQNLQGNEDLDALNLFPISFSKHLNLEIS